MAQAYLDSLRASVVASIGTGDKTANFTIDLDAMRQMLVKYIVMLKTPGSLIAHNGDVSGDNRVTMYDAALVLKYTVGGPLTSAQQAQADINSDTTIDATDAMAIGKKALGL